MSAICGPTSQSRGAILLDESQDPDVTENYYGEGDHISDAMMRPYTELFWRKLGPRLTKVLGAISSARSLGEFP